MQIASLENLRKSGSYIGRNVYVGPNKNRVKHKSAKSAQVYDPAEIGDGVFIGPSAFLQTMYMTYTQEQS